MYVVYFSHVWVLDLVYKHIYIYTQTKSVTKNSDLFENIDKDEFSRRETAINFHLYMHITYVSYIMYNV